MSQARQVFLPDRLALPKGNNTNDPAVLVRCREQR